MRRCDDDRNVDSIHDDSVDDHDHSGSPTDNESSNHHNRPGRDRDVDG